MNRDTQRRLERLEAQTAAQRQDNAPWYVAGRTEEEVDAQLAALQADGVDVSNIKAYIGVAPDGWPR